MSRSFTTGLIAIILVAAMSLSFTGKSDTLPDSNSNNAVKCTLSEVNKSWRPLGGKQAQVIKIKAHAELDPTQEQNGLFRFRLTDVSREKGYAMNAGVGTDLDLQFSKNQNVFGSPQEMTNGWQIMATKTTNQNTVWIESMDYGAWGKLKAEVYVKDEWHDCFTKDGTDYVTIPYDQNENHIADFWEERYRIQNQGANDDLDGHPQGKELGDGFSNYEEYRGFSINGIWQTTDPTQKDLFIYDESGISNYLMTFQLATGLTIHSSIREIEYNGNVSRVVNFNHGYGTQGPQKGLHLKIRIFDESLFKQPYSISPPNRNKAVTINLYELLSPSNMKETTAHMLGHGINIPMHGFHYRDESCNKGDKKNGVTGCQHMALKND